jgi:hypothetical protein
MSHLTELSPQERLAISRKALVRHMSRHRRIEENEMDLDPQSSELPAIGPASSGQTWRIVKYAMRNWWYRHPASAVVDLAEPLLHDYAQAHPFKLLLISAGAGAAAVVLRPWRMVSAGVLLAALKSSGLPGALLSGTPRRPPPQPFDSPSSSP